MSTGSSTARAKPLLYQIATRLGLVAVLFTLLNIVLVLIMYLGNRDELAQELISSLSQEIADSESVSTDGRFGLGPEAQVGYAAHYSSGQVRTVNPYELLLAPLPMTSEITSWTQREELGAGRYRISGFRTQQVGATPVRVAVTVVGRGWRTFVPTLTKELIEHAAIPLLPLAVLLIAVNTSIVRRMLQPLQRAAHDVVAIDPSDMGRRLQVPAQPLEIQQLVRAFNDALDRIETSIGALRDFTADAAHELRTPLSIMSLSIENLPDGEARRKLQTDSLAMTRLISQMLDFAWVETLQIPTGARADLAEVATSVVENLTPLAVGQRRAIHLDVRERPVVHGVGDVLGRALRNILDNAIAHTPAGTAIDVTVGPGAIVAVRDHGPGIPDEQLSQVFKRFWRSDRTRASGSGLGLGIAARIVQVHEGMIRLKNAEGGGLLVEIELASAA